MIGSILIPTAEVSAGPVQKFKPDGNAIATVAVENDPFTTIVKALVTTELVEVATIPNADLTVLSSAEVADAII